MGMPGKFIFILNIAYATQGFGAGSKFFCFSGLLFQ